MNKPPDEGGAPYAHTYLPAPERAPQGEPDDRRRRRRRRSRLAPPDRLQPPDRLWCSASAAGTSAGSAPTRSPGRASTTSATSTTTSCPSTSPTSAAWSASSSASASSTTRSRACAATRRRCARRRRSGWTRYFSLCTDHKVVGIQYLWGIGLFFFIGGLNAMLIRTELLTPDTPGLPGRART